MKRLDTGAQYKHKPIKQTHEIHVLDMNDTQISCHFQQIWINYKMKSKIAQIYGYFRKNVRFSFVCWLIDNDKVYDSQKKKKKIDFDMICDSSTVDN